MLFRSEFKRLWADRFRVEPAPRRRVTTAHSPKRCRPRLELLEDRTLLSTFFVDTIDDSGAGSLRQAVLDANDQAGPDEIHFSLGPGANTITLTGGELTITDTVSIIGPGADLLAINGNDNDRVFHVAGADGSAIDVEMHELTIAHGRAAIGGGILNSGADLTLVNCT